MFAGTALSVRVFVYVGLSFFIINGPYLYVVVCIFYTYNLTWGGLKNGKNWGEPNRFCLVFVVMKRKFDYLMEVASFSLIGFGRFSLIIPPCLFTVHVRPVLSPCQAGNTCCIFTCVSNSYTMDNVINTICTRNVYNIICSTASCVRDHRILTFI